MSTGKRGRPAVAPEVKKSRVVGVPVTQSVYAALKAAALKRSMKVGTLARSFVEQGIRKYEG